MALTELQLPAKQDFYNVIKQAGLEMDNLMAKWQNLAEAIERMDGTDLDAMGVPTGQIRTDLVEFRQAVNELVDFYNGVATTQTNVPADVIDKVRAVR